MKYFMSLIILKPLMSSQVDSWDVAKPDENAFEKMYGSDAGKDITEWYYVGDNYINDDAGC